VGVVQAGKWQEESSFLKKRSKKLLGLGGRLFVEPTPTNKVFLLLFVHKKKILPCLH
jgi:hypothetical protein